MIGKNSDCFNPLMQYLREHSPEEMRKFIEGFN